jgi:hypothetical protein
MSRALLAALACLALVPSAAPAQRGFLAGWVLSADDRPPGALRAWVRWGTAGADSVVVDAAGRFRLPLPAEAGDTVEVRVDAADPSARRYHPALAKVVREVPAREAGFVLVPLEWTVEAGDHAGSTVRVSPALARAAPCPGCSAFWPALEPPNSMRLQLWPALRFPLRVAFDRANASPAGSAVDSVSFWRAVEQMEGAFGQDLFRPAPYGATLPRWNRPEPDDVVRVVADRALRVDGLATLIGRGGAVDHAVLRLRDARAVQGPRGGELVVHELMHVLGVGHTCAWRSVTADLRRCLALRAPLPTAEDVAYTQLLYRVRHLQTTRGARWGLDAALAGEAAPPR